MMQQGYYTKRIDELEKRKEEVTAQLVTSKLTLKGINKEIENCYEYMNSANYAPEVDTTPFESKIKRMEQLIDRKNEEIENLKNDIKKLNKTISKKNKEIESLNTVIENKDYEMGTLKLKLNLKDVQSKKDMTQLNRGFDKKLKTKEKQLFESEKKLRKENKRFEKDNIALNEKIATLTKTIIQKDKEIEILHERLNWQPVKHRENIFEELLEEAK